MTRREAIIAEALTWIGTPYSDAVSVKGVGADCLGLIRGVWRNVYGSEAENPPKYGPGWFEASRRELLLEAADRNCGKPKDQTTDRQPGDLLMFRMAKTGPVKHCGILIAEDMFVHAYSRKGVTINSLGSTYEALLAAVYSFPET